MKIGKEILINASLVTNDSIIEQYEFIIDGTLTIQDSIKVKNLAKENFQAIEEPEICLRGMLFELNHIRVNPSLNNEEIVKNIMKKLNEVGVEVKDPPSQNSISVCFKPLGTINSSVRFYVNHDSSLVFLSPMQPKLIRCKI